MASESKTPVENIEVRAWSCAEAKQALTEVKYNINVADLKSQQVIVKVHYCGICASDIGILNAPFKIPIYPFPLVAGHEGVGEVIAVGEKAAKDNKLKVGDRVGLGVYRHACGECRECLSGNDNQCAEKALMFAMGQQGAFADHMIIDARFAFKIPDAIKTEDAGPLMCAGLTTYSPFRVHNVRPGDTVGVVGIGGLGHLAIQWARKWGCKVYAFSSGADKEALAKELGAHVYIDTSSGAEAYAAAKKQINFMMVTASGKTPYKELLSTLKPFGKLILMGLSYDPIPVSSAELVTGGALSIVGSAAGSSLDANDMLQFAALHGIRPMVEVAPISAINDMISKVAQNKVRFRGVVKHDN
jgi:uncharacterized zinc-type alcohol dehydrogenase-like protein